MLEDVPAHHREKFANLRPGRKMIMLHYFRVHAQKPYSPHKIIPDIANDLGYKIDTNGSSSYLLKVIREFFNS